MTSSSTPQPVPTDTVSLAELQSGIVARIVSLTVQGAERRRLMDLGFVPGAQVAVELKNPLGDPRAFRVMGGVVAIRREQAAQVTVRKIPGNFGTA